MDEALGLLSSIHRFLLNAGFEKSAKCLKKESQKRLSTDLSSKVPEVDLEDAYDDARSKMKNETNESKGKEHLDKKRPLCPDSSESTNASAPEAKRRKKGRKEKSKSEEERKEFKEVNEGEEGHPQEDKKKKKKGKEKKKEKKEAEADVASEQAVAKKKKKKNENSESKNVPFKRIDDSEWSAKIDKHELKDNSFWNKKGDDFARKAAEDLSKVKGRDFRHEKSKKKRASWKGAGEIDMGVNSIQFSDDE